ncbi:ATP-binding protein [Embleya sp. NPDC020630]|uniref:ATP-binding protein n=1 Tax=Embleya sp. NPDC020630 TaxID=3363979 RepID=UPI00378FF7AC
MAGSHRPPIAASPPGAPPSRLGTRRRGQGGYPGSDIGLAMCKKIVEFHGGTIAVDPHHHDGARITFTLAAEPPQDPDPSAMPQAVARARRSRPASYVACCPNRCRTHPR